MIGEKKSLSGGRPVHPVKVQLPPKRGAVANVNCVELLMSGVPIPGEPFKSVSAAMACPSRSKNTPAPTRSELLPGPPNIAFNKPS